MTDTAELKPVAWVSKDGLALVAGGPFATPLSPVKTDWLTEPLYSADALSSLVRERDAKHAMFLYEADKHSEWLEKFMAMKAKCEAAEADAARMREALEPFAEFGRRNVDDHGWKSNIHREGISVWFGPSEFRAAWVARNALGGKDAV